MRRKERKYISQPASQSGGKGEGRREEGCSREEGKRLKSTKRLEGEKRHTNTVRRGRGEGERVKEYRNIL
jgi:hypothetical protein